jgi:UDP-N-acetyl-D-glucosamine dehydrogenase
MTAVADLDTALQWADCVVVATDHSAYDFERIGGQAQLVVDTRGATVKSQRLGVGR